MMTEAYVDEVKNRSGRAKDIQKLDIYLTYKEQIFCCIIHD